MERSRSQPILLDDPGKQKHLEQQAFLLNLKAFSLLVVSLPQLEWMAHLFIPKTTLRHVKNIRAEPVLGF